MNQAVEWKRLTIGWSIILLIVALGCLAIKGDALTLHQVQSQDIPILVILGSVVAISTVWRPNLQLPERPASVRLLLVMGVMMIAALAAGAWAIFDNYPLTRDEHMVLFDMAVYGRGHLAEPLPPFWRPFAGALVPDFLLNERMPVGLVSGYLPVNALFRLAFSKIASPVLLNPLLAVLGGAALMDVARRTFGPTDRACWVVLLVYVVSAQMLVNAMTPYSMTAHMTLNLIWLAAFLRGGKLGIGISIVVGFLAVGLHQLAFHPVFVAPFLLWRLREGQWRLVFLYAFAYAVILAWWISYPLLPAVQSAAPSTVIVQGETHQNFLTGRLLPLLAHRTPGTTGLMVLNLMRFFAWQNFALLPLLVAGVPVGLRQRGLARALILGIFLWLALVTLLMPYQGLGWGFRYLSPYLGSFALLAGFGYRVLVQRIGNQADSIVIALSTVTVLFALPLLLITTHEFVRPYVVLDTMVEQQRSPFVIIDTAVSNPADESWAVHPLDQVRNSPDLSNRPLRFSGNRVNASMVSELCAMGKVTMITRSDMRRVGFGMNVPDESPRFENMAKIVDQASPGCIRQANTSFTKTS